MNSKHQCPLRSTKISFSVSDALCFHVKWKSIPTVVSMQQTSNLISASAQWLYATIQLASSTKLVCRSLPANPST